MWIIKWALGTQGAGVSMLLSLGGYHWERARTLEKGNMTRGWVGVVEGCGDQGQWGQGKVRELPMQ